MHAHEISVSRIEISVPIEIERAEPASERGSVLVSAERGAI